MKIEYAETLAASDSEMAVIVDYSGRGMYGEKTAAVVFPELFYLLRAIAEVSPALGESFASAMGRVRTDSLGRGYVAY
jgi:hypothetical protein